MAQTYTYQEIGARVRSRATNPDVLKSFSDDEIGKRAAERNPAVAALVVPAPAPTPAPTSPPTQQPLPPVTDFLGQAAMETGAGFLKGAAKGIASTASGASALGEKYLLNPIDKLMGNKKTFGTESQAPLGTQIQQSGVLAPQGAAEKIGHGVEQTGEFFAADALTGGTAGLNWLTKANVRALQSGGLTAMQKGEVGKDASKAAILSSALSVAGDITAHFLSKVPNNAWDKILRRTPTEKIKDANLGQKLASEGVSGISLENIGEKAKKNISSIGDAVTGMLDGKKGTVDMVGVSQGLEALKRNYAIVPGEEASLNAIDAIQKQVASAGNLDQQTANVIKQKIYRVIEDSYGRQLMDLPAKTAAQKEVAKGIKLAIEKVTPEVKTLNERQGLYLALRDAIREASAKGQGQGILGTKIGLYDLGVFGAGSASGGPIAGAAAFLGKKALESTAFMTNAARIAQFFNDAPPSGKMAIWNFLNANAVRGLQGLEKPRKNKPNSK